MALAGSITNLPDMSRRQKTIPVAITPSGNYVTGGDTLDLTAVTNPKFVPGGFFGGIPIRARITNSPNGYDGEVIFGATLQATKVKYYTSGGVELPAAAYPAALLADPLIVEFIGPIGKI